MKDSPSRTVTTWGDRVGRGEDSVGYLNVQRSAFTHLFHAHLLRRWCIPCGCALGASSTRRWAHPCALHLRGPAQCRAVDDGNLCNDGVQVCCSNGRQPKDMLAKKNSCILHAPAPFFRCHLCQASNNS